MPATLGISGTLFIAGMARSYHARLSLFVIPACGDGAGGVRNRAYIRHGQSGILLTDSTSAG
jgi:hypothetical protein